MKKSQNIIESIENSLIDMFCVATKKKDTLMYRYSIYRTNRQEGYLSMDEVSLLII